MNYGYLLPPLVVAGISTILLVIVLLKAQQRGFVYRIFSLLLLSITLWALAIFAMRTSPDAEHALLWERAMPAMGFATAVFYYHFSLVLTKTQKQRVLLYTSYLFMGVVATLSPTSLFIQRMDVHSYGYAPIIGSAAIPVLSFAYFLSIMALYKLVKRYRASHLYEERNRLLYVTLAMVFPLVGSVVDLFPNIYPASIFGNIAFCLLTSVAILKYNLLDIRIVARKSLAYLLVSIVIAIPYVSMLVLLNQILNDTFMQWWAHTIIILLLAILLRPLYSWAQNVVDRLFYRDRYDFLKALEQFSQEAKHLLNLKELSSTLTQLVSAALRTSSVCLLLPAEDNNGLVVVSCTGLNSPPSGVVLRNRSLLIKWLKLQQRILSSEEFDIVPQLQSLSLRERNNLKQMGAKLYVPIQNGPGLLSGILILGQKLSQQPYSSEERELLTALSSQMAIALENVRLYNESQQEVRQRKQAEDKGKELRRQRKQAEEKGKELQQQLNRAGRLVSAGELAAGVAHEVNNPLTGIMGFSERLLRKSADEDTKNGLELIHNEAQRAAKVVKNLLTFIRHHEPAKEYTDINDIVQKSLELRAYELKSSNIEVTLDLAANLPQVMVDFHEIQAVFLNIILNAEQSMSEAHGGGKLSIKTREVADYISISFADNGPGIPAEHLDKIFDPFFTSKGEKGGTGLGLSICQGIITEHGGRIYVRIETGEGATFFVELPIATKKVDKNAITTSRGM